MQRNKKDRFFKENEKNTKAEMLIETAYTFMQTKQGVAVEKEKKGDLAGAKDSFFVALKRYDKLLLDIRDCSENASVRTKLATVTSFFEKLKGKFISIPYEVSDDDGGAKLLAAIDAAHQEWSGREDTYARVVEMGSSILR